MTTMTITVQTDRGPQQLAAGSSVADLLDHLARTTGLDDSAVATAVNGEFVSKGERGQRTLQEGDAVLCFAAITGG